MDREFMYMMEEIAYAVEEVVAETMAYSAVNSLVGLLVYVFSSLAFYTIAQRREIKHAWLAWIPVLNLWILGSISDQYRYVAKGEVKSKRKVLLILQGIVFALGTAFFVLLIDAVISFFQQVGYADQAGLMQLLGGIGSSLILLVPMTILAIVSLVFEYMALYDVYASCDPSNAVVFLVLSLIPGINRITYPLFLFLCRNQDKGMPPRKKRRDAWEDTENADDDNWAGSRRDSNRRGDAWDDDFQ